MSIKGDDLIEMEPGDFNELSEAIQTITMNTYAQVITPRLTTEDCSSDDIEFTLNLAANVFGETLATIINAYVNKDKHDEVAEWINAIVIKYIDQLSQEEARTRHISAALTVRAIVAGAAPTQGNA